VRIAFDSRPAKDVRGIGRYARCLLGALREHGCDVVETHNPRSCDVFHAPWIDGAILRPQVPMVVTLHDLVPLKRRGEYLRTGLRFRLRYLAVQRAARVIVPSEAVAQDAVTRLGLDPERVAVIRGATDRAFTPRTPDEVASVRQKFALSESYLLWVGGLRSPDPRKRVAKLARAKRKLPLVLVGPASRWARELPGVRILGEVSDDQLAALYTGAHALVFPSDEEGFGLPPVEALACGTPVAACNVPVLRETLDDRVSWVDVDDLDGLIAAAEAATRPAPSPPPWTWSDAARATRAVYEAAAASTDGRKPNGGTATRRPDRMTLRSAARGAASATPRRSRPSR
jgi:glycosyltransferase involved in cell wall biosynthesis